MKGEKKDKGVGKMDEGGGDKVGRIEREKEKSGKGEKE